MTRKKTVGWVSSCVTHHFAGAVISVSICVAAAAFAQTPAASADEQARLAAAKDMFESRDFSDDLKLTTELEIKNFAVGVARSGGQSTEKVVEAVEKAVAIDFAELTEKKTQIYIRAMASQLTVADMQALADFNRSAIGKKFASVRVLILRDIYSQAAPLIRATYAAAWHRHKIDFEKLGLNFGGSKQ
jgi:hypothetical protein